MPRPSDAPLRVVMPMAFIIGIGAGVGAWLLKWLVHLLSSVAMYHAEPDAFNWQLLFWPLAGIGLTALATRYLFTHPVSRGCDRLHHDLASGNFSLSPNIIWESIGGCSLTVGLGASAGTEGPIAYAGAAIGSVVGRWFRIPRPTLRVLVACGAGAGIAAIFKSPIGGLFFIFEIMHIELDSRAFLGAGVCCLVGALSAFVLSGCTPDIIFTSPQPLSGLQYIGVVALGLLTGLYARWYDLTVAAVGRHLLKPGHAVRKVLVTGLGTGIALLFLPALFADGYPVINHILCGDVAYLTRYGIFSGMGTSALLLSALAILAVKGVGVAAANDGGGVAGDFSPTLFAGCILGWLFAFAANSLLGLHLPPATFACIGMAAAMSAILKAPLMAIFIAVETTGAYSLLLPVTAAAIVSFIVIHLVSPRRGKTSFG